MNRHCLNDDDDVYAALSRLHSGSSPLFPFSPHLSSVRKSFICEETIQAHMLAFHSQSFSPLPPSFNPSPLEIASMPRRTIAEFGSKSTIPDVQTWSRLQYTSLVASSTLPFFKEAQSPQTSHYFVLHDHAPAHSTDTLRLSSSKWSRFYHSQQNDEHYAVPTSQPFDLQACDVYFSEPVIIINVLTWQVGHLLVDVLEPLYNMLSSRSEPGAPLNTDVRLVLHVADSSEQSVLHEKILRDVYSDTPFSLLRNFTSHPIHTYKALFGDGYTAGLNGTTCFRDISFELDVSNTYYTTGFDRHLERRGAIPEFSSLLSSSSSSDLSSRYQSFKSFLNVAAGPSDPLFSPSPSSTITSSSSDLMLFIERSAHRTLTNLDAALQLAARRASSILGDSGYALTLASSRLEDLGFRSSQLPLFRSASIVIAQYGSGAHNVLFMPSRGSVLILLMQPGWCPWSWSYVDQALLSGVSVVALCSDNRYTTEVSQRTFRWTHKAWEQGPWRSKDSNWGVGLDSFGAAFDAAEVLLRKYRSDPNSFVPEAVVLHDDQSRNPPQRRPQPLGATRKHFYFPPEQLPLPRVHVSDLQISPTGGIEFDGSLMMRVSVVVEVITAPLQTKQELDNDRLELCAGIGFNYRDIDEKFTCFKASVFNEFSTFDFTAPIGAELPLSFWLQFELEDGSKRAVLDSETYYHTIVSAPTRGLGISTVNFVRASTIDESVEDAPAFYDSRNFQNFQQMTIFVDEAATFTVDLYHPTALQGQIAAICREARVGSEVCLEFTRNCLTKAAEQGELLKAGLPMKQYVPTLNTPFVFLHHEKTAGSSLRRYMAQTAKRLGLGFYLPCYDGDAVYWEDYRCYSFDLRNASAINGGEPHEVSVMGGHFDWNVWNNPFGDQVGSLGVTLDASGAISTASEEQQKQKQQREHLWPLVDPACLIMVRHPVDRAISLYYERVFQRTDEVGGKMINELDLDYWKWILEEFKGSAWSRYRDEGLCDTMCKMLLSKSYHRGKFPEEVNFLKSQIGEEFSAPLNMTQAIENLDKCVVGIQNDWQLSKEVIWHWFPWLKFVDDAMVNTGMGDRAEKRGQLRPELREELEKCNQCDMAVWEHSLKKFKAEEKVVRKARKEQTSESRRPA